MIRKKQKCIMFIDETGNADAKEEPFTLTGVIFEYKYAVKEEGNSQLEEKLMELKKQCFGNSNVVLHLTDIARRKKEFKDISEEQRKKFYDELPNFLASLDFTIISVTVDKQKLENYYTPSKNPYIVAFTYILQNFYSFIHINDVDSARIVIEARDDSKNLAIQKSFFDVYNTGTTHLKLNEHLQNKIKGFIIAEKGVGKYQSGLEIADLLTNPLSRVRRGLLEVNPTLVNYGSENLIFAAIKDKIYTPTDNTDLRNWGFQKVPITKKKREWINNSNCVSN